MPGEERGRCRFRGRPARRIEIPSEGVWTLAPMNRLRDKAIARKAHQLRREAHQLEQISRHQPRVSQLVGEARRSLAAVELQLDPGADCTFTSRDREDLQRLAFGGNEDAFAELTRREPVAA